MDEKLQANLIQRVALGDILRRAALRLPDKEAMIEHRGGNRISLTYREMNSKANQFARALQKLGLRKGDRVATICLNSHEYVLCIYGLAKGGFVFVPVNPGLNPLDILYILENSGANALIIDDVFLPALSQYIDRLHGITHIITLPVTGKNNEIPFIDFNWLLSGQTDDEILDVIIEDRDTLQIMYTSGTTAKPKGVVASHLAVYLSSLYNCVDLNIRSDTVLLALLPMCHCAQHTAVNSIIHVAAAMVIMRSFTPDAFLETASREKINWTMALPMVYRTILEHPDLDKYDLSSLKTCLYVMAPIDRNTFEKAQKKFGNGFMLATGQTEAYPATNFFLPQWQSSKEGNYWGISTHGYETAIMDDNGDLQPQKVVGEIVWRGPAVMKEYYRDEHATQKSRRYGWHHSGDLGYFDEDGLLVFVDRKKDMIKTGGENVPSIKVEEVIMCHPKVEAAAVVGLTHRRWIEAVTAFVVLRKGADLSEEEIITWCKKKLGIFEIPKKVVFVDDLPRTTTGKVQKNILRSSYKDIY
ncbi:AMP-binding protein [Pelotomaculum propionicicum]|uniref:Long-chain-fatty-acid--CoA ligase n=1 Tax=Pelotomaculum propionicicum TaxID=258475 RepID=A0A4Y7RUE0_9FIRM|nr:AMP-binding protein [Pelotomaculum propionicicum]NLI12015.1 AMP-binding protein [Peptococcaceae bacterium]TEB12595.1 Long-chain-fatty-acid--CoA ligase [Pelotomaculum propionicicum]